MIEDLFGGLLSVPSCRILYVLYEEEKNVCSVSGLQETVGLLSVISVHVLYFHGGHISSYSDIEK